MDDLDPTDDLDFSRADVAGDGGVCGGCQQPIGENYFDINGTRTCEPCGVAVRDGVGTPGSRFLRASLFGLGAAIISALVWYGIRALTGYEIGLIAIAAGFVIGIAVRNGSGFRGGAGYQALAIVLTYSAIAVTYIPVVAQELISPSPEVAETDDGVMPGPSDDSEMVVEREGLPPLVAYLLAVPIGLLLPVLQVFDGGFIGLILLLIALYEAWKLNKRPQLNIQGPFPMQHGPAPA